MQDYTEVRVLATSPQSAPPPPSPEPAAAGAPLASTLCSFFCKSSLGARGNYAVLWHSISHCFTPRQHWPLTASCGPRERVQFSGNCMWGEKGRGEFSRAWCFINSQVFFTSTKASFGAGMFRRFKQERKTVKKCKSNSLSNHIQHI